jgi:hypothetical protein
MLAIYARSAGATLAAIAPLALTYAFWAPPATITFLALCGTVLAGAAAWLAAMILLRHPTMAEFSALAAGLPLARRLFPKLNPAP